MGFFDCSKEWVKQMRKEITISKRNLEKLQRHSKQYGVSVEWIIKKLLTSAVLHRQVDAIITGERLSMPKLVDVDGMIQIWEKHKKIAFVENDILYRIDSKGYAVEICKVNHRIEILGKLAEYNSKNSNK